MQLVHDACNPAAAADLAAVLITDGLANVLLIGSSCTVVKAKIESTLPRKRGAALAGYEKAVEKFFTKVAYDGVVCCCVEYRQYRTHANGYIQANTSK